jgi:murein L,D-transpeptidase YafK
METTIEKQACRRRGPNCLRLVALVLMVVFTGACIHNQPTDLPPDLPGPEPKAIPITPAPQSETAIEQTSVPEKGMRIVVSKADRLLMVYSDGEVIRRYRVGLGFRPQGPKRWKGDGRTPEGRYVVAIMNPHSRYFLSLGLNYPMPIDAAQGYKEGRITWAQYQAIRDAFNDGKVPPWNTRLGGEIFIHGHGATRDWTRGCIALDNADMQELYSLVDVGTPVTILP